VAVLTSEQQEQFLERVRSGEGPSAAANAVGATATRFKFLATRDEDFHARYQEARETGRVEYHAELWKPTEDQEEEFLSLIREGHTRDTAARELNLGKSGLKWRGYCRRNPTFDARYREALDEGYAAYRERLRSRIRDLAFEGSERLLEKEGMVHLPEWRPHLTKRIELANAEGEALRILAGQASSLSDEELKALIERLERLEGAELKALPAQVIELPLVEES
jgi:hypothetical protein